MPLDLSALRNIGADRAAAASALKGLHLFEEVDAAMLASIVEKATTQTFSAGATILTEGEASNGTAYVVLRGSVEVRIGNEKVAALSVGALFGEYALISSVERTASVVALEETECLLLDEEACFGLSDGTERFNEMFTDRIKQNSEKGRGVFA